jgi:hypothetical protein
MYRKYTGIVTHIMYLFILHSVLPACTAKFAEVACSRKLLWRTKQLKVKADNTTVFQMYRFTTATDSTIPYYLPLSCSIVIPGTEICLRLLVCVYRHIQTWPPTLSQRG